MSIAPSRFAFAIPLLLVCAGVVDGYRSGFENQDWLVLVAVGAAIALGLVPWRNFGALRFSETGVSCGGRSVNLVDVARVRALGGGTRFAANVRYEFLDDAGQRIFLVRLSAYGVAAPKVDRHLRKRLGNCAGAETIVAGPDVRLNALLMYAVIALLLLLIAAPGISRFIRGSV